MSEFTEEFNKNPDPLYNDIWKSKKVKCLGCGEDTMILERGISEYCPNCKRKHFEELITKE